MKLTRLLPLVLVAVLVAADPSMRAQPKGLTGVGGELGLGLVLRQLGTTAIFLETGAHPDDENNGLLAMLGRGLGVRTAMFTCTRGTGGQNEIGPELFEALSVLRTEELASVHRYDGAEQYFGREIDFGYSFSIEETFQKWGRDETLSDYVRMIRTIRPDVVLTMRPDGEGGGMHHQAQARITGDAYRAAADPNRFPGQLKEGLRPWQARKLYYTERYGFRGEPAPSAGMTLLSVSNDIYDSLLGQTYVEIGSEARSNHKCQGMGQLLSLPGPQTFQFRLGDTSLPGGVTRADTALFDGVDTTVPGLAQFVRGTPPDALAQGLTAIAREVENAQKAFAARGVVAARGPIVAGLRAVRALRAQLSSLGINQEAVLEIDYRLATKEQQFQQAAVLAQEVRIDVLADDGLVIGGQPIKVQTIVANRAAADMQVKAIGLSGFDGNASCRTGGLEAGGVLRCDADVRIPGDARLTTPYWRPLSDAARYEFDKDAPFGLPFRPTPFRARIDLVIGGVDVSVDEPVKYRYEGNIFSGEKRMELLVVPRFSVGVTPDIAIIPSATDGFNTGPADRAKTAETSASRSTVKTRTAASASSASSVSNAVRDREIRVVVINGNKGAASAQASLDLPAGWTATPPSQPVEFAREDASETVRFSVSPPADAAPGQYKVRAIVRAGGEMFDQGYQVIEYPHINRRHRVIPAETSFKVIDVKVAPKLKVGYVMGVGDQVPPAIEQLGADVVQLGADDLAWGNLSTFDAIVTGVRAYERRADLRANNRRLIDYADKGGTLIVQYNKFEFNEAQYGPYPAKVSSSRVTDENAPVQVLVPADPIFTFPNTIAEATWKNWVQERGLYFLGNDKDPRYVDLVQLEDPFPANRGTRKGALVEARIGKGRWIYVGLGLWRQLPAGTDGAYQLLANLLSVGRTPR
ncbi:MAG TPA: PIG-L family deacetylase [Vicinamibacterales bacterium]|jgi:LmbE family N-acetylglucosaminyl deacetylase